MATLTVTPVNSRFGARVTGVDLCEPIGPDLADELRALLWQHGVLVFPEQEISREQQLAFTGVFATPAPQPVRSYLGGPDDDCLTVLDPTFVVSADTETPAEQVTPPARFPGIDDWHSDSTFAPEINAVATLRAEVTPPVGGDTSFATMAAAFDDLSPLMQEWLEQCEAVHAYPHYFKSAFKFHLYGEGAEQRFDEKYVPWRHPVVVRHPQSGRRSLFVNPVYTTEIVGLSAKESRELLTFLFRHCTSTEYVYRHHWTPNDVVIWDELSMIHLAPQDFAPHPRRMIRVTGGVLVPPAAGSLRAAERQARVTRMPVAAGGTR